MKPRTVTVKDVRDAALIGQIIGAAALANAPTFCVCADDDHCGHALEEDCVAAAIGAAESAIWLWLAASNAIATPHSERAAEIAAAKWPSQKKQLSLLYAWVDDVSGAVAENAVAELTAAALLREGVLPPGWRVVPWPVRSAR